jgi:hypothetical protein
MNNLSIFASVLLLAASCGRLYGLTKDYANLEYSKIMLFFNIFTLSYAVNYPYISPIH